MLAPRIIVTTLRTAVYSGLAGWLAITNEDVSGLLDALLLGAVSADYLTWGVRSLVLLPDWGWPACWEGCVNVAFGYVFYHTGGFKLNADPSDFAVACLTFMFVGGVKLCYYAALFLAGDEHGLEP